ncbi:hypothetical protein NDU88_001408 [Pleurodeles waltl]|uniref:Uncharacterized protein n=1 Tax=Pleurodeles waltl TaxID=8319 RepID=A0AAV7M0E7_PLEWA|nr:hypothetical protein NDU88_001408 [Pleurodeles waltl]
MPARPNRSPPSERQTKGNRSLTATPGATPDLLQESNGWSPGKMSGLHPPPSRAFPCGGHLAGLPSHAPSQYALSDFF